jgi:prepilin peptidase CpaA
LTAVAAISGVIGVAACVDDLRRRQISNWIPCTAFAAGVILQSVQHGLRGTGAALLGVVAGASVFLVFYLLGGMGGGDVKLMAGFGALLGVKQLLRAALWTAGCGGLMALLVITARAVWKVSRRSSGGSGKRAAGLGEPVGNCPASERAESIPYAPAIAAGVWLSLVAAP